MVGRPADPPGFWHRCGHLAGENTPCAGHGWRRRAPLSRVSLPRVFATLAHPHPAISVPDPSQFHSAGRGAPHHGLIDWQPSNRLRRAGFLAPACIFSCHTARDARVAPAALSPLGPRPTPRPHPPGPPRPTVARRTPPVHAPSPRQVPPRSPRADAHSISILVCKQESPLDSPACKQQNESLNPTSCRPSQ